jgi:hypothetical protein
MRTDARDVLLVSRGGTVLDGGAGMRIFSTFVTSHVIDELPSYVP